MPNFKHGMKGTRFYNTWCNIKKRCNNPKREDYRHYGNKGIKVCERWNTFTNFMDDMYESYVAHCEIHGERQTTIERKDSSGDYEPSNCCWATYSQQAYNKNYPREDRLRAARKAEKKRSKYYSYKGTEFTIKELSEITGVNYHTIRYYLVVKGLSVEQMLRRGQPNV